MLSRRRCPHTGVVNFFAQGEPWLAVGSVIKVGELGPYHWRCYFGRLPAAGVAPDKRSAEVQVFHHYREMLVTTGAGQHGCSVVDEGAGKVRGGRPETADFPEVRADP